MSHETSTPSGRIQRKRLEKKELIVDTAMALLAEGGLEALTVSRLAKALDYTPGALYRYFPSMEVLLVHMQERAICGLGHRIDVALAALEKGRSSHEGLEVERLRAVARCYLGGQDAALSHEVSLIGQMLASPKILVGTALATQTAPALGTLLIRVESLITRAQEAGTIRHGDARQRAVELWAALQGALALGKLTRFDPELFDGPRLGLRLVDHLLSAWGSSPKASHS